MPLPAPNRLALTQLEARDTPAAAQLTDIMPGVWGSYPQNVTPSDQTLFFSADNGHGYELYASDGTTAGTKMVKDIKPGRGGSNPTQFYPAGNGIVFFTANDGGGETLWRSNGTAAGTFEAAPMPTPYTANGGSETIGFKGDLYFLSYDPATQAVAWWKTDGTINTKLTDFDNDAAPGPFYSPAIKVVGDRLELAWRTKAGMAMVWQTDGTAAGTRPQQLNLSAFSPTTQHVALNPGVRVASGKFVFLSEVDNGPKASAWVGDGTASATRQLLRLFDGGTRNVFATNLFAAGGKAFFGVYESQPPHPGADFEGLYETDGTAAGTKRFTPPAGMGRIGHFFAFGDRLLLSTQEPTTGTESYWVSDGTTGGTTKLVPPAGAAGAFWSYTGYVPATETSPKPLLVFQNYQTGQVFRTDGTAAGTAMVDTTGLPALAGPFRSRITGWVPQPYHHYVDVAQANGISGRGAYFNGAIYFPGRTDVQRPELWKWDLVPPPPTATGPTVTAVEINGGAAQRSMVTTIKVSFDQLVTILPGAIRVIDAASRDVDIAVTPGVADGKSFATVTFTGPSAVGRSIADGAYKLQVDGYKVYSLGGVTTQAFHTTEFFRLFGDLDGDRLYNREARWMAAQKVGATRTDPRYDARFDFNADGLIDKADELEMARRWFKTV